MNPKDWIALAGIVATAAIAVFSVLWNTHVHRLQRKEQAAREDEIRQELGKKEQKRREEERLHAPRVDLDVDVKFVGRQGDRWLVEIVADVENSGLVCNSIEAFDFSLRCIYPSDPVEDGDALINYQAKIPHKIKSGSWLPVTWTGTVVEPGTSVRYTHIAAVPSQASFVFVHGRCKYSTGTYHTADKLIRVPSEA